MKRLSYEVSFILVAFQVISEAALKDPDAGVASKTLSDYSVELGFIVVDKKSGPAAAASPSALYATFQSTKSSSSGSLQTEENFKNSPFV